MSGSRLVGLPLAFVLFIVTGCVDMTGPGSFCFHSEGCDQGGGLGSGMGSPGAWFSFGGLVTSDGTGRPVRGVTVRIEAPVRKWTQTVETDSTGRYWTLGPDGPAPGDCEGLSATFSREGYQTLVVTEFPGLKCQAQPAEVNAVLTPKP